MKRIYLILSAEGNLNVDSCQERGDKCARMAELLPAVSPRTRTMLVGFHDAFIAGDYTLAENRILLLQNHSALRGRYAEYLFALIHASQGRYQEVRERLAPYIHVERLDDLGEAMLWLSLLLDYIVGDWITFDEHVRQYSTANLINGCVCLYKTRLCFLQGIISLRENALYGATESFRQAQQAQHLFPITAVWGKLGEIEVMLRLRNHLIARMEITQLAQRLGAMKPLAGWQLFFPATYALAQRQGIDWRAIETPLPMRSMQQVFPETSPCRLFLFGTGRIFWHTKEITAFQDNPDAHQLIAYLALKTEGATGHEILMDLWPDRADEEQSFMSLLDTTATWTPEPLIRYDQGVYYLRRDVWVDAAAYTQRYNEVRASQDISALLEVRQIYTAPLLHGLSGIWVDETRTRFQLMQSWLLWHLSQLYRAQFNYAAAQAMLEASVDSNHTFDRGMNDLMRLLEELGLRGEALRRYEYYRKRIWQVYHVPPSPHLQQLAERLQHEESQITGAFQASDFARAVRQTKPPRPVEPYTYGS